MASRRKTKKSEEQVVTEQPLAPVEEIKEPEIKNEEPVIEEKKTPKKVVHKEQFDEQKPKYKIGSIVYVSKDAGADLNGFKLFPQYKKYTYTVEAYDDDRGVYTLRRLNLSLRLPERFILAPEEKAHDSINRKQF